MGVTANFGTKVDRGKGAVRLDPDVMEDISIEWGDKGDRVVVEVNDVRKGAEEVLFNEFLLRYPKLLTTIINDGVLVGVTVDGKGTSRGMEKIGEEVGYRLFM